MMQAMGSASTYSRRYAIQVALGIAPITEEQAEKLHAELKKNDAPMPRFVDDDGRIKCVPYRYQKPATSIQPSIQEQSRLGRILHRNNYRQ